MVEVIKADKAHLRFLADNMREADINELMASSGLTPYIALCRSLELSSHACTVTVDGSPALIFGVCPVSILGGVGTPWLLGTPDILKIKKRFIKECHSYVSDMNRLYPHLINRVDVRNTVSIKWLIWLGFTLKPALPIGINGELFYPFEMRNENV